MSSSTSSAGNNKLVKISLFCVNRELRKSYSQQKDIIVNGIQLNPYFNRKGIIWQTLERGVNYPVIHYLPLDDLKDFDQINQDLGEFTIVEVLYEEIKRMELPVIVDNSVTLHNQLTNHSNSAHIFLGFKTLDKTFNVVLEENWKDWTGARNLYLNLSPDFGLSKICFLRKIVPNDWNNDWNAFMYILIADCTQITHKNRNFLLDFVDRFRLQRLSGYLTVYTNILNDL